MPIAASDALRAYDLLTAAPDLLSYERWIEVAAQLSEATETCPPYQIAKLRGRAEDAMGWAMRKVGESPAPIDGPVRFRV